MLKELITASNALRKLETAELRGDHAEELASAYGAVMTALGQADAMREEREKIREERDAALKKLQEIDDWQAVAARYQLFTTEFGSNVYKLKSDFENEMPVHYLCANCFNSRKQSILNPTGIAKHSSATDAWHEERVCHACGSNACFDAQRRRTPVVNTSRRSNYFEENQSDYTHRSAGHLPRERERDDHSTFSPSP